MQVTVNGQSIRVPGCAGAFYSGSAGIYSLSFEFSPDWDGWGKTAVFQSETGDPIEVPIVGETCVIPWEVLQSPGRVKVGVYGVRGDDTMPTAWADSLIVRKGTPTGTPSQPPTPDVY